MAQLHTKFRRNGCRYIAYRISDVINPALGRITHLPNIKSASVDASKHILFHFLYLFLQVIHDLIPPNPNQEGGGGLPENPTDEHEITI